MSSVLCSDSKYSTWAVSFHVLSVAYMVMLVVPVVQEHPGARHKVHPSLEFAQGVRSLAPQMLQPPPACPHWLQQQAGLGEEKETEQKGCFGQGP